MDDHAQPADTRLLALATVAGMLAILALPLSATVWATGLLAFALPVTFVAAGRVRGTPWMVWVGAVLLVLVATAVLVPGGGLGPIGALVLLIGPVAAALLVGVPLRDHDPVAGGAFLVSGTIAIMGGFLIAAADPLAAALVVTAIGGVGVAVVLVRLRGA